ncbi:type IV secretion system protein [Leptotrichia massiliensis]|uniref:type IV secretion system protein n=1 Tax=Leptotrichia massiliensis TaxID=1852388 RepID=UPI0008DA6831|nr:type IV secretion system protein [Leptotrichia massiliensis]
MAAANFQFDTALIEPIISMLDTGMTTLMVVILTLASSFAVLDLSFTAFFNWSENIGNTLVETIKKLVRYALTFGLIKMYKELLDMAYKLFSDIGNLFGEGLGSPLKVQSIWDKLWEELSKFLSIVLKFQDFWAILYFILFIIGFIFLVFIISTITIAIIQFHVVGKLAIIYLACLPLDALSDIGRKTLGAIVGSGTQLMVAVALSSMGVKILKSYPIPENIGAENNEPHTIIVWLAVFIAISFLIKNYQSIASLILYGQGGLNGSQLGNFTGNVVSAGGSAVGGVTSLLGSAAVGGLGAAVGAVVGGVSTGGAGAIAGMKTGAKIGSKIGKYPGNLTASAAENAGKAIKVMTMDFDPIASGRKVRNMASDGIKKFMGNKKDDKKDTGENKSQETENTNSKNQNSQNANKVNEENKSGNVDRTADTKEAEEKMRSDSSKTASNKDSQKQSNEGKKVTQKHSENTKTKETENSNSETFAESEMRREKNSKE